MYYKKKKNNPIKNFKYLKVSIILIFFVLSFILGAYSHKKHFFYTFIKPIVYQNINFFKKQIQGKFQKVEKIYLNIQFEVLDELNSRKIVFLKNQFIIPALNTWLDVSINFNNQNPKLIPWLIGKQIN